MISNPPSSFLQIGHRYPKFTDLWYEDALGKIVILNNGAHPKVADNRPKGRIDYEEEKVSIANPHSTSELDLRRLKKKIQQKVSDTKHFTFWSFDYGKATLVEKMIVESANKHLIHLEDLVFQDGLKGIEAYLSILESTAEMLSVGDPSVKLTTKFDGAPVVVAGWDNELSDGNFFVGTKSVFNKTPKLNYSHADLIRNHKSGLVSKLSVALKYLKPIIPKNTVYQGDMMFTKDSLEEANIDGEKYVTFTPNTITYAFPWNSEEGKKVRKAEMGIVFHTQYDSIENPVPKFNISLKRFGNSTKVWYKDASLRMTGSILSQKEHKDIIDRVEYIRGILGSLNQRFVDTFTKNHEKTLNTYLNQNVRLNTSGLGLVKQYKEYLISKNKDHMVVDVESRESDIQFLFNIHKMITNVKTMLVRKLEQLENSGMFIKDESGYRVVSHEGFVAIPSDGNVVKLVDRLTFSRNNFTVPKNWK